MDSPFNIPAPLRPGSASLFRPKPRPASASFVRPPLASASPAHGATASVARPNLSVDILSSTLTSIATPNAAATPAAAAPTPAAGAAGGGFVSPTASASGSVSTSNRHRSSVERVDALKLAIRQLTASLDAVQRWSPAAAAASTGAANNSASGANARRASGSVTSRPASASTHRSLTPSQSEASLVSSTGSGGGAVDTEVLLARYGASSDERHTASSTIALFELYLRSLSSLVNACVSALAVNQLPPPATVPAPSSGGSAAAAAADAAPASVIDILLQSQPSTSASGVLGSPSHGFSLSFQSPPSAATARAASVDATPSGSLTTRSAIATVPVVRSALPPAPVMFAGWTSGGTDAVSAAADRVLDGGDDSDSGDERKMNDPTTNRHATARATPAGPQRTSRPASAASVRSSFSATGGLSASSSRASLNANADASSNGWLTARPSSAASVQSIQAGAGAGTPYAAFVSALSSLATLSQHYSVQCATATHYQRVATELKQNYKFVKRERDVLFVVLSEINEQQKHAKQQSSRAPPPVIDIQNTLRDILSKERDKAVWKRHQFLIDTLNRERTAHKSLQNKLAQTDEQTAAAAAAEKEAAAKAAADAAAAAELAAAEQKRKDEEAAAAAAAAAAKSKSKSRTPTAAATTEPAATPAAAAVKKPAAAPAAAACKSCKKLRDELAALKLDAAAREQALKRQLSQQLTESAATANAALSAQRSADADAHAKVVSGLQHQIAETSQQLVQQQNKITELQAAAAAARPKSPVPNPASRPHSPAPSSTGGGGGRTSPHLNPSPTKHQLSASLAAATKEHELRLLALSHSHSAELKAVNDKLLSARTAQFTAINELTAMKEAYKVSAKELTDAAKTAEHQLHTTQHTLKRVESELDSLRHRMAHHSNIHAASTSPSANTSASDDAATAAGSAHIAKLRSEYSALKEKSDASIARLHSELSVTKQKLDVELSRDSTARVDDSLFARRARALDDEKRALYAERELVARQHAALVEQRQTLKSVASVMHTRILMQLELLELTPDDIRAANDKLAAHYSGGSVIQTSAGVLPPGPHQPISRSGVDALQQKLQSASHKLTALRDSLGAPEPTVLIPATAATSATATTASAAATTAAARTAASVLDDGDAELESTPIVSAHAAAALAAAYKSHQPSKGSGHHSTHAPPSRTVAFRDAVGFVEPPSHHSHTRPKSATNKR